MIKLKTTDNRIFEMKEELAFKSILIENIHKTFKNDFIKDVLLDFDTLSIIYYFMKQDNHSLKKEYNFLEIYFSQEMLHYFDEQDFDTLIEICNGANYLEYPYLLELCCKIIACRLSETPNESTGDVASKLLGDRRILKEDVEKSLNDDEFDI